MLTSARFVEKVNACGCMHMCGIISPSLLAGDAVDTVLHRRVLQLVAVSHPSTKQFELCSMC